MFVKGIAVGGGLVAQLCPAFATPWTVALQAPLSMRFPRQEYWSGLLFPPLGYLPNSGIEPVSPALQVDSLPQSHLGSPIFTLQIFKAVNICVQSEIMVCEIKRTKV